jgi:hypothetical protein
MSCIGSDDGLVIEWDKVEVEKQDMRRDRKIIA